MAKKNNLEITRPSFDKQAIEVRRDEYFYELAESAAPLEAWANRVPAKVRERVFTRMSNIKHGMHSVGPLICLGPQRCPFFTHCPIPERDHDGEPIDDRPEDYPIGLQCVLEGQYIAQKIADYVQYLQVDPSNPIEMSIVNELALIDMLKNRGMLVLSAGDKSGNGRDLLHVDQSVLGFSENGTPLTATTTKLHPVLELIDRLEKRREKWLDKMMETREAKAAFAAKMGNMQQESKVLNELQEIAKFVQEFKTTNNQQEMKIIPLDDQEDDDE